MREDEVEIRELIESHIEKIVSQWDADNIIFEDEYGITSVIIENYKGLIYEMIIENGGHEGSIMGGCGAYSRIWMDVCNV